MNDWVVVVDRCSRLKWRATIYRDGKDVHAVFAKSRERVIRRGMRALYDWQHPAQFEVVYDSRTQVTS